VGRRALVRRARSRYYRYAWRSFASGHRGRLAIFLRSSDGPHLLLRDGVPALQGRCRAPRVASDTPRLQARAQHLLVFQETRSRSDRADVLHCDCNSSNHGDSQLLLVGRQWAGLSPCAVSGNTHHQTWFSAADFRPTDISSRLRYRPELNVYRCGPAGGGWRVPSRTPSDEDLPCIRAPSHSAHESQAKG
jgi:hypothetical protein